MTSAARRTVVLGATAAALLLLSAPPPAAALRTLRHAGDAIQQTAPLVALLSLCAWLLAAWLLVIVALTAGSHLPGTAGGALAAVARRTAPATVRRAVEVALGLTVVVGVLGASPAAAAPGSEPAAMGLDWAAPAPQDAPGLDWADAPAAATAPAPALDHAAPAPAAEPVVVQPGDSLWDLAEQDLAARGETTTDASVAQAWPTWWAANRDVVGDDPDLLLPGTPLTPPASS